MADAIVAAEPHTSTLGAAGTPVAHLGPRARGSGTIHLSGSRKVVVTHQQLPQQPHVLPTVTVHYDGDVSAAVGGHADSSGDCSDGIMRPSTTSRVIGHQHQLVDSPAAPFVSSGAAVRPVASRANSQETDPLFATLHLLTGLDSTRAISIVGHDHSAEARMMAAGNLGAEGEPGYEQRYGATIHPSSSCVDINNDDSPLITRSDSNGVDALGGKKRSFLHSGSTTFRLGAPVSLQQPLPQQLQRNLSSRQVGMPGQPPSLQRALSRRLSSTASRRMLIPAGGDALFGQAPDARKWTSDLESPIARCAAGAVKGDLGGRRNSDGGDPYSTLKRGYSVRVGGLFRGLSSRFTHTRGQAPVNGIYDHHGHFESLGNGPIPGLRPDTSATRRHSIATRSTEMSESMLMPGGGANGGRGWMEGDTVRKLMLPRTAQSKPSQMKFIGKRRRTRMSLCFLRQSK